MFHQPSRLHLHSLRTSLLSFPTSVSLRGLRDLCCGSFPPSGRVISLRAAQYHHLLSPCTKALGHLLAWGGRCSGKSLPQTGGAYRYKSVGCGVHVGIYVWAACATRVFLSGRNFVALCGGARGKMVTAQTGSQRAIYAVAAMSGALEQINFEIALTAA